MVFGSIKITLRRVEDCAAIVSVFILALLPVIESFIKLIFKHGILFSQPILTQALLVTGCAAGMIAVRSKGHLSIGLINYIKNKKIKNRLGIITNMLSAFVSALLVVCSAVYVRIALDRTIMIGIIPEWIFSLALPVCFFVMAARFRAAAALMLNEEGFTGIKKFLSFLPVVMALVCAVPLFIKFIWLFDLSESMWNIHDFYMLIAQKIYIPLVAALIICALAGAPLFVVFGALAMMLFETSGAEVDSVLVNVASVLTTSDYAAIPLFALVGFFLSESKAGVRLVETFKAFCGWVPGGLIIVTTLICAFFTTFTGASGVTILALGGILYTVLSERTERPARPVYPQAFSRGLLTATGSIGLLFPPSLPIILVGITMQQSILKFFAAGFLPGIVLLAAVMVFGIIISARSKIPLENFNLKHAARSLKNSIFELLIPVLLLAGFFSGFLSVSELGAAAFVYVFIIEVFVKRDIPLRDVPKVFAKALPIIGGIFMILALSKAFSEYIIFTQAPQNFAAWLQHAVSSKILFLLLLNAALLITGCLMDIFSAIAVMLPLIAPLGAVYGIDPLHLGIIFLINLEAGYLTPPVGLNLFLASYRFEKPFVEICRNVLPFLLIQLAVVLLVTYMPFLSTWLPKYF